MEEFFASLPSWVKDLPDYFTGLVLVASVVAKFTATKVDDRVTSKAITVINDILHTLPTIGLNPRTKKMKEALDALKGTNDKSSDSPS